MGMSCEGGDIVEVEGRKIVKGRGRKDGHSKVYTSKGPRDRRVRLSAHTAIDFYDVQDRLGYDRPSKAVDWLINKAKPFIDKLSHPFPQECMAIGEPSESCVYDFHLQQRQLGENQGNFSSASSAFNFQSPPTHRDLGLSLHLFQDHPPWQPQQAALNQNQTHYVSSTPVEFVNHYQRIVNWNNEANKVESMVSSQPCSEYCPSQTLQSSFSPSVGSWNDIHSMASSSSSDHHRFLSHKFCIPTTVQVEEEDNGPSPNKN